MSENFRPDRGIDRRLDLRQMKSFVAQNLPRDHPLRDVLLSEADDISVSDFLARLKVWLVLSYHE